MGGSKPSAPVTYIPTPAAPTLYKSVIPEADFKRAADYLARIKADRKEAERQRYLQVGTPEEIGDRQAEIRAREAATYAASLPKGSEYDFARAVTSKRPAEITDIYRNILGREPDVSGLAHYTGSRMSIKDIENDIFQSPENRKKQGTDSVTLPATTVLPPAAAAAKPSEPDETPSWAIGTPSEMAAQAQRDKEAQLDREAQAEEARVNRMIQAKELAEKAKKAGVDGTATSAESTPALADSAARYV